VFEKPSDILTVVWNVRSELDVKFEVLLMLSMSRCAGKRRGATVVAEKDRAQLRALRRVTMDAIMYLGVCDRGGLTLKVNWIVV